jgi:hypothetical protein
MAPSAGANGRSSHLTITNCVPPLVVNKDDGR